MAQQLLSAQQAAEILGLQVRTVRQYVREGRLPGVRIGKQYRIARADLDAFGTVTSEPPTPARAEPARPVTQSPVSAVEVSAVVQVMNLAPETSARLERTLAAVAAAADRSKQDDGASLRVEPLYDARRGQMTVVVLGTAAQTAQLLQIIDAVARD